MIKLLGALIGTIAVVLTLYLYLKFEEKELLKILEKENSNEIKN